MRPVEKENIKAFLRPSAAKPQGGPSPLIPSSLSGVI